MLKDWLSRNSLDADMNFYTNEDWVSRKEDYLNDAEFVIVTEGGLCHLLNYAFDHPKVDELQDLCESFGYWFDLGHTWSIGFYKSDVTHTSLNGSSYKEKLRDSRWTNKAKIIKARTNGKCEDCGILNSALEAHHCWYRYGFEPWQYPLDAFRALCKGCHQNRAKIEHEARALFSSFTQTEIKKIHTALENLFYWYDRQSVHNLLENLGPDGDKMKSALTLLMASKTEPGAT